MKNLIASILIIIATGFAQAAPPEGPFHPMDALTLGEIETTVKILKDAGNVDKDTTFPAITLREAPKDEIRKWQQGQPFTRAAFLILRKQSKTFEAIVDLTKRKIVSLTEKPGEEPMIMDYEWVAARDKFMADPRFKAAIVKRGLKDMKQVFCTPNSAGTFPGDGFDGRRILKIPCFSGENRLHPLLARPIDGHRRLKHG
jgi:primary-amine oxidase